MAQAYTALDYVVTSGSHIFYTGGTNKRMRIDNTGNVNIGTTGQNYKLYVNGTTYFNNTICA